MTIPNGQTGLRSDHSWALLENAALREQLQRERTEHELTRQQLKEFEDRVYMDKQRRSA